MQTDTIEQAGLGPGSGGLNMKIPLEGANVHVGLMLDEFRDQYVICKIEIVH